MAFRISTHTPMSNTLSARAEHLSRLDSARLTTGERAERASESAAALSFATPVGSVDRSALMGASGTDRYRAVMALTDANLSVPAPDFGSDTARMSRLQDVDQASRATLSMANPHRGMAISLLG